VVVAFVGVEEEKKRVGGVLGFYSLLGESGEQ